MSKFPRIFFFLIGFTVISAQADNIVTVGVAPHGGYVILGGTVIGLAIIAGWWITGGSIGQAWKEYAEMSTMIPSRVQTQSFTFISPMGDSLRYLMAHQLRRCCARRRDRRLVSVRADYASVSRGMVRVLEGLLEPRPGRRADGHRRGAGHGMHHRPGYHRCLDARDRLDPRVLRHRDRRGRYDEVSILAHDAGSVNGKR